MSQTIVYTHTYEYRQFLARARQPIIAVELFYDRNHIWRGDALLDSGADYSVFDASVAHRLGIEFGELPRERISGVGGAQLMYKQRMGVRVGPMLKPVVCQVYFVEGLNKQLPNAVGRNGLFEHLLIGIDEANKKIYMVLNS